MPPAAAAGPRPAPQAAYAQWIDACAAAGWRGAPAAEPVPVSGALGRVTAAPVRARWPSPHSACAAMDGIAISSTDASGSADTAGRWRLAASAFAWVDTGDPLPEDMDTVVERERVRFDADGSAQITGPAPRGLNVRARGEDFQAGQLLIPAGHRLRPADLAAAAAAGHAALEVARRPVAAIIPTGDEIRPIGSPLRPGDVTDSYSLLLALRAEEAGARSLVSDVQPDDPDVLAAELRRAALAADIVLVIAGSSAGRSDHTAAVIAQAGGLAGRGYRRPRDRDPRLPARRRGDLRAVRRPAARRAPGRAAAGPRVAAGPAGLRLDLFARRRGLGPGVPHLGRPGGRRCRPGHAGQARRRGDQPAHARPCLVADSHRAGKIRPRGAHRRPADTRRAPITGQRPAGYPRAG